MPAAATAARPGRYVGLVTRAIAFTADAVLLNAVAIATAAAVALAFTVLTLPSELKPVALAVGGAAYLTWTVAYFAVCWSTTGQTPGARLMRFRVCDEDGATISPRRALLRFVALTLAAIPLFAGFLPILVDDRRRGFHDRVAGTVVVDADGPARGAAARPHPRPEDR
ncbi:RDD family protein [Conexibacter arvalis]|uniref:Putative RDD family membrane protein YckC n=1 Tax=Conexibacter arvalis TaxID=912552 RepID=A0A840I6X7_9ACTN|nr:RDD family protein [Conexibacter arvalis]MBB4660666.1 putative RDD family membrane protein YckC [Conexibacter arvalis]